MEQWGRARGGGRGESGYWALHHCAPVGQRWPQRLYPIGGHITLFVIRLPLPLELPVGPNRSDARWMQFVQPQSMVSISQLARSGDHSRSQQRAHGSGKALARHCSRRIAQRPSAGPRTVSHAGFHSNPFRLARAAACES